MLEGLILFFKSIYQKRQGIQCSSARIHAKVKMCRPTGRVTRVADVAEDRLQRHIIAHREVRRVRIEMRVVVNSTAPADDRNRMSSQMVFANPNHVSVGRGNYRSPSFGKNVLPFVQTIAFAWRMPGVGYLTLGYALHRHLQILIRDFSIEFRYVDHQE